MDIAIIGTGNVGGALAGQWSKVGHRIYLGVRDPQQFKGKALQELDGVSVHSIAAAVSAADVILVATPPHIALELVDQWGDISGKTLIDATNAIRQGPDPYPTAYHAFTARTGAEVVKCFNTTGYENMQNSTYGDHHLDLFMAGDSPGAKQTARQLAQDAGFAECYDFGESDRVQLLEQFALAWINLSIFQGMGRNIGFKLLQR